MSAHDFGVLVKYSPVSGLCRRYLMASQPCLSLGLIAVPPRTAGLLSAIALSVPLKASEAERHLQPTKFTSSGYCGMPATGRTRSSQAKVEKRRPCAERARAHAFCLLVPRTVLSSQLNTIRCKSAQQRWQFAGQLPLRSYSRFLQGK